MHTSRHDRAVRRMRQQEEFDDSIPCSDKRRYRSQQQAEQSLERVLDFEGVWASKKFPTRAYFCDGNHGCFGYHLTSQEG